MKEFVSLVYDLIHSEEFIKMKEYQHHVKSNLYEHSVRVAYLCYNHHKRFNLKTGISDFVRGAMLHDYYLYDLHGGKIPHRLHWLRHPAIALENAIKKYPSLTSEQRDMIKRHMFPLTVTPPKTLAGWLICLYDKIAAIIDRFGRSSKKIHMPS